MVDYEKLNAAIAESGIKLQALAGKAGMTRQALHLKMAGKTAFTVDEAKEICTALAITSPDEICQIFFA